MLYSNISDQTWLNACTKESWRREKHISNLIRFFIANFLVELYYLNHLLFKQAFFIKTSFWLFSTRYISFKQHIFILDRTFFYPFQKYFFFGRKRTRHLFFAFLFKIKHYPITRKKQNEKPFFLYFSEIQNTFFCFDKSQIFRVLMTLWNLLTQKQENFFFNFSLQKITTHVHLLYYQPAKEIWEQKCPFRCPKFG